MSHRYEVQSQPARVMPKRTWKGRWDDNYARVSLSRSYKQRNQTFAYMFISVPIAIARPVFGDRDCLTGKVIYENGKLRWILRKYEGHDRQAQVRIHGMRFRFLKAVYVNTLSTALGRFQVQPFSVLVNVRVGEVEDLPGQRVIVLEMDEALQAAAEQSETSIAATPMEQTREGVHNGPLAQKSRTRHVEQCSMGHTALGVLMLGMMKEGNQGLSFTRGSRRVSHTS